jgi:hypothetical protein
VNNEVMGAIDWLGAIAIFASSEHSFNAAPVWQKDYELFVPYDNFEVRGNDLVRYEITATADGNDSGITGISVRLNILSSQAFGILYTNQGKHAWSRAGIMGSAILSSYSSSQKVSALPNGDKEYVVDISVYVYEKASDATHQSSAPIKKYTLTLKHIVKE